MRLIYIFTFLCLLSACICKHPARQEEFCPEDTISATTIDSIKHTSLQQSDTVERITFSENAEISVYNKIFSVQAENKYWKVELTFVEDSINTICKSYTDTTFYFPMHDIKLHIKSKCSSEPINRDIHITRELFSFLGIYNLEKYNLVTCKPITSTKDDIEVEITIGIPDSGMFEIANLTISDEKMFMQYVDHPEPGEEDW